MKIDLSSHDEGCTPLRPGLCCKVTSFLRTTLQESGWRRFLDMIEKTPETTEQERQARLELGVHAALPDLSYRTARCLKSDNILLVRDLVLKSEQELLRIPDFGRKSLIEVKEGLHQIGWSLAALPREGS